MQERLNYLDTISGLFILFVITSHIFQITHYNENHIYILIYEELLFFYMPWFFFKSGMFHNIKTNSNKSIHKIIKKLLIPYVIFSFIGYLIYCFELRFNGNTNIYYYTITPLKNILLTGTNVGNPPLWFLLSLCCIKILTIKSKFSNVKKVSIFCCIIIIFISISSYLKIIYPFWAYNTLAGLFFYLMGYILKNIQFNKLLFVTAIIFYCLSFIYCPSYVDMRSNSIIHGNYYIWIINSIMGIILINNLFKQLYPIRLFTYIGKNSMTYYVTHWLILYSINIFYTPKERYKEVCIMLIASIIILPILDKIFRTRSLTHLIGK